MANRRFIDFPIAASVGDNDIVLIWQDGLNKQTTKATLLQGSPSSLAGLTDVDIAALTNGQILQYNSTTSKWENVDRTDINLSQLGDVTIVAPANGQVLVYNSSTSKWENSSAGYVPYTGAVTTVNLGAQSILAGSFVKAGGTSAQFLKADGSVDSSTYGTGTVTSVALTMPTAFSVANSPVTTTGTLAVTATGTTAQYIRGDGSLETFPALTGFVPYTGATADVNLGTHDLLAERGTFENNGSSNTLTVNHTSGSGYGIIVTKGGNNEALYVSKTSGSGNAMTVVGGRTSLVDLALSSVTNTAGDFLTLSGGVVHKRTAAQTLTDIGGQAALTNPVTGTGTTNYLAKFTGTSAIGNSLIFDNGTNVGINTNNPSAWNGNQGLIVSQYSASGNSIYSLQSNTTVVDTGAIYEGFSNAVTSGSKALGSIAFLRENTSTTALNSYTGFYTNNAGVVSEKIRIASGGNLLVGTTTDAGFKLDVNGTGRFSGSLLINEGNAFTDVNIKSDRASGNIGGINFVNSANTIKGQVYGDTDGGVYLASGGENLAIKLTSSGNVGIGTDSPVAKLEVRGLSTFAPSATLTAGDLVVDTGDKTVYLGRQSNITGDNTKVIMRSRTGTVGFSYNPSDSITFFNDGNVLIGGTTDNGAKLQVNGNSNFSSAPSLGGYQVAAISNSGASTSYGGLLVLSANSKGGYLTCGDNSTTTWYGAQASFVTLGATLGAGIKLRVNADDNTGLAIGTNGIIDMAGPLVVRGTLPADQTDAAVIDHNSNTMRIFSYGAAGVTGDFSFRTAAGGAGSNLVATINGITGIYTALGPSDLRIKENVKNYEKGLQELLKINVKEFEYNGKAGTVKGQKAVGFIAGEIKDVMPEWVGEFERYLEKDDTVKTKLNNINLNDLPYLMIKAIQELKQEIDTLKN